MGLGLDKFLPNLVGGLIRVPCILGPAVNILAVLACIDDDQAATNSGKTDE